MALRLITSGIGLIVFFAAFFADELLFSLAVAIVSLGMVYEAVHALKPGKLVTGVSMAVSALSFLTELYVLHMQKNAAYSAGNGAIVAVCLIISIFVYLVLSVVLFEKTDFKKIYSSMFMTFYITWFMTFIILLRRSRRHCRDGCGDGYLYRCFKVLFRFGCGEQCYICCFGGCRGCAVGNR